MRACRAIAAWPEFSGHGHGAADRTLHRAHLEQARECERLRRAADRRTAADAREGDWFAFGSESAATTEREARTVKELAVLIEGARIKRERLDGEITHAEAEIAARTEALEEPRSASSEAVSAGPVGPTHRAR